MSNALISCDFTLMLITYSCGYVTDSFLSEGSQEEAAHLKEILRTALLWQALHGWSLMSAATVARGR